MPRNDRTKPEVARRTRTNALLASLPRNARAALEDSGQVVELTTKQLLHDFDQPIRNVYFVHRGVASLVKPTSTEFPIEVATVGYEGMVGLPLVLGVDRASEQAFMQVPGSATRIRADRFRQVIADFPDVRDLLLRYTVALMGQMAQGAACNRSHPVDERCARWLLMTHDRVETDSFPLTQEFLAQMLGVRRPSVSIAAGMLQKSGLIQYVRGVITIVNRDGLE